MTCEEIINRLKKLRVWQKNGNRAPNKPLLILLALGKIAQKAPRLTPYTEIQPLLIRLLKDFGPHRTNYSALEPFRRLPNDNLWTLPEIEPLSLKVEDITNEILQKYNVHGGFPEDVYNTLRENPNCILEAAQVLLDMAFPPESYDEDIIRAVGLECIARDIKLQPVLRQPRNPHFRNNVLIAYQYRCAVCDYYIRLKDSILGVEAAHIHWYARNGPDEVTNGIALCTIHHRAFDRGGISIDDNLNILISPQLNGDRHTNEQWFQQFRNKKIEEPQKAENCPKLEHLNWHREQVFRP